MAPHFVKRWLGNRAMRRAARERMTAAKRSMPSKFFRPMLEILEDRTLLSVSWISTQSGFWDVGSNWSTGQAPTASDDVTINQPGVTVTVRNAAAAGTLSGSDALTIASGGSLNIANASTFGGNVSVSSGGTLSASASTTLSGSLNNAGALTVQAGTLTVSGTVSQVSGTSLTGGAWNVDNGATLDLSSAPNLTTNAATVSLSGTAAFTQLASITTDSGSLSLVNGANFSAGGDFTISGSLSDDTGQLSLNNHQLTISSGGTLFVGNSSGLGGGSQITNAGTFQVSAGTGTMTIGAAFNNQGGTIDVESGTLQTTGGTFTGGSFIVQIGAVYEPAANGSSTVWTGTFTGSGGGEVLLTPEAFGNGTIQIGTSSTDTATFDFPTGMFQWQGGNIYGPGTLIIAQGGFLSMTGSNANMILGNNNPVALDNEGTILHTGTGTLVFGSGAVLDNEPTGVYNFQAAGSFSGNSGFNSLDTVNNQGTFEMSGSGTAQIQIALNNLGGTMDVESGTLAMVGGNGASTGGTFTVAQNATLDLTGGGGGFPNFLGDYTGTYTGSGAGTIALSSLTLNIGIGGLIFNFPGNLFQWTGGNINSSLGDLTNLGTMTLAGPNDHVFLDDGTLDNKGIILQTGTGNLGLHSDSQFPTTFKNEAGAIYDIEADSGVDNPSGGTTAIINDGTIRKSAGSGTSTIQVNGTLSNTGTIEADSGTLALSATVAQVSGGTLTAGTWNARNGSALDFPTGTNITSNEGSLTLDGPGSTLSGIRGLSANSGSFTITNGASFTTSGNFSNTGSLDLGPGSTLTVNGTYTQGPASTLQTELGGTPGSGQFGQLAASGAASLAGTLQIGLTNGYAPAASDSFEVMGFASHTGNFSTIEQPIFHGGDLFGVQTNATNVTLAAATAVSDLEATGVSATSTSVQPGQNLTVNYTVKNLGNATSATSWVDAVFLSADGKLDSSAILLGRVNQTGPVAANGTYSGTLTAALPFMPPGNYTVIVEADSQGLVPDSNRANNVLAATTPVQVTVPVLPFSPAGGTPTPVNVTLAPSQQMVFQLTVPAPNNILISAGTGTTQFLVGYGAIPTASANIASSQVDFLRGVQASLEDAQAGTYYVVVQNKSFVNTTTASLTAQAVPFGITNVSPNSIPELGGDFAGPPFGTILLEGAFQLPELLIHGTPQEGNVTITVTGNGFTPNTTVSLTGNAGPNLPPATVQAQSVLFKDSHTLFATFTLDQLRTFSFDFRGGVGQIIPLDVQVSDHGQTADFQDGVELEIPLDSDGEVEEMAFGEIPPPGFTANLTTPGDVRVGRPYTVTINYSNNSGINVPAPLLSLSGQGAEFQLPGQSGFTPNSILLFAGNPNGQGGVLPPGFSGSITVTVINSGDVTLQLGTTNPTAPIDWSKLESSLQPPGIPAAAWNAIFANFTAEVGTTSGSLQTALDNDANYLSQLGEYTSDVTQLLAFQVDQAGDFGAIAQRYTSGMFGLGIPDPTVTAVTDSQGNVSILSGNTVRGFALQADGSYLPAPGDFATLTLTGGVYQLRETDGTLKVFNVNGSLNFTEDTNGNKTLYGYTGNQLTSITNTLNGDVTTFTYNAQGFVSQITDPEGRITSLTYDSAGHLLSITDPLGTTSYTYVTSGTPQQLNAVASITNPDGSQVNFTYNSQGQLIAQTQNGGADPLTFSYNVGALTTTDALNDKTTALLDENGQLAEVIDPLGNVSHVGYSSNLQPTSVGLPGGLTGTIAHDALGNPISAIDPLGNQTTATFNPTFSKPQTVTDPAGNSLNYSYDSNGNMLAITYPDGSSQQYQYNALGQVTQFTNRNGQAIAYTYYPNGLLKSETLPDGSQDTFTYDNHRNLVSMTDSTGTTTFAYDAADRLTKVTYPNGSFLSYTYNSAGQRIQMTDQTGFTVNYQYDALGRLTKLTDANGNLIVSYTYDDAGRLSSKQFSNGDICNYTYDAAGNVLSIVNLAPDGKTVQSSYVYTYNSQGLPATMTTSTGTFTYGYDASGQLTSVQTPSGQTITYQYDAAGNRTAVVSGSTTTPYTTNNLNEYTQVGNTTYQYDANGELIASTNSSGTTTYQYNALGQLVSVASPTGTTTYQYNALGQLVAENVNGTVTNLLVDPTGLGNVVGQFTSSGNPVAQYAYGLGLVSQTTTSGSNNFYSFDLTGNTTQLTGSTGSVLNAYSYLPFGEQFSASGSTPNPFTYVGEFGVLSDTSGLDFMRNRWYDAGLGRFTQPDPTSLAGGDVNLYRYVRNSPLLWNDPTGLDQNDVVSLSSGDRQTLTGVGQVAGGTALVGTSTALAGFATTGGAGAASGVVGVTSGGAIQTAIFAGGTASRIVGFTGTAGADTALGETAVGALGGTAVVVTGAVLAAGTGGYLLGTGINHLDHVSDFVTDFLTPFVAVPVQDVLVHGRRGQDPNDITGPTGFGTQGFLPANTTLPYRIDFTNEANATAPADVVTVTEQLDPNLDLTTFQLGDLGFGNTIIQVPAGLTSYSTTVNLPSTAPGAGPNGLEVEISASLNPKTGLVTWTFTSIDPTTQDIPIDPSVGFLPPDVTAPEGEGFVSYTIQPKSTITASTPINAQATVVFDQNAPLNTPQISNVLDPVAPTSSVSPLPATTTSPTFNVSWSGHDDTGGSGIASYSVFVSDNGGNFTPLLSNTTQTSTTFTGQAGHTYSFFSVAVDNVGNLQPLPTNPQATITVVLPPPPPASPPAPPTLQVPPLLEFIDALLGGVETLNANGTETITDFFFGFPLFVSTFDSSGNLVSVDLFGFLDITFLFG